MQVHTQLQGFRLLAPLAQMTASTVTATRPSKDTIVSVLQQGWPRIQYYLIYIQYYISLWITCLKSRKAQTSWNFLTLFNAWIKILILGLKQNRLHVRKQLSTAEIPSSVELFMEQQRDFQNIYADNKVLVEIEILQ